MIAGPNRTLAVAGLPRDCQDVHVLPLFVELAMYTAEDVPVRATTASMRELLHDTAAGSVRGPVPPGAPRSAHVAVPPVADTLFM